VVGLLSKNTKLLQELFEKDYFFHLKEQVLSFYNSEKKEGKEEGLEGCILLGETSQLFVDKQQIKNKHCFQVSCRSGKALQLFATSGTEMSDWMKAIYRNTRPHSLIPITTLQLEEKIEFTCLLETDVHVLASTNQLSIHIWNKKTFEKEQKEITLPELSAKPEDSVITKMLRVYASKSIWIAAASNIFIMDDYTYQVNNYLTGHQNQISSMIEVFSQVQKDDPSEIWTASYDQSIRVWDPLTTSCITQLKTTIEHPLTCLAVVGFVVWCGSSSSISIWNALTKQLTNTLSTPTGVVDIVIVESTHSVWTANDDTTIRIIPFVH